MALKLSPYGMVTCSICDKPTVYAIPTERGELLPYCSACAKLVQAEFPEVQLYLYSPRPEGDLKLAPGACALCGEAGADAEMAESGSPEGYPVHAECGLEAGWVVA